MIYHIIVREQFGIKFFHGMYPSKLIIIRGNSGSGKTTVVRRLRELSSRKIAIVEQDVIRRHILNEKVSEGAINDTLILQVVEFALAHGYDVLLEGILSMKQYGPMLQLLIEKCPEHYVYYFEISFEETLKRHATKPNKHEFGEKEMKTWYREKDFTHFAGEKIIPQTFSLEDTLSMIMKDAKL